MEEKRLVRTDKSLRCILYTHHKYYPLTALCLAGDNIRGRSQFTILSVQFVNVWFMSVNSENVVLNMITRQAGLWTSLTGPGAPPASARGTGETGDCLFGFGCSPLSWILVHHYVTRHTSHITGLSLTRHRVTITRAPLPTRGRGQVQALTFYIYSWDGRKELYPAVFLLGWADGLHV